MGYQLGVDLGTTYTAAAVIRDGRAEVSTLGTRSLEIPSVVLLRDDGELLIGEAAERRSQSEPDRFVREFKRRMGDPTPVLLGGSPFSAHALTARLLRGVVKVVADREGGLPDHIVVTCPANWGEYKRDLLAQAVHQADVGRVSLATEPEAAAVHYASTTRVSPGEIVAVYDLGGGTFDAAVLRNTGSGFELLGDPRGIEQLGGVYFDEAVFAWVVDHMREAFAQLDPDDPGAMAAVERLRRDCVDAKESLSWDTDTVIPVSLPNQRTEVRLTRAELEDMIRPTLVDTIEALERSLASAGVEAEQLKSVLLVGGSSRIPLVGQMLVTELRRPVAIDVHPKHAVALGAARLAAVDAGALARPADAPVPTLDPTQVTRSSRTTVTSPAGMAVPVEAPSPRSRADDTDIDEAAARTGDDPYGTRLPSAREQRGGAVSPDRTDGTGAGGAGGTGGAGGRNPLVLAGIGVAAVALVAAGAVFALGGGGGSGDDEDEGGGTSGTAATETDGGSAAGVGDGAGMPADFPRGEPLAESTLAYTQVDGTFWNVWLIEADGSNPRTLTRENVDKARLPAISPDRTAVAYSIETAGGWELRVIDSGGTASPRLVSADIVPDARATWSPDGSRLAFVGDRDGPNDIYVLDLASGELTNLTSSPEQEGDPAWSPDGGTIAYWSLLTGNQEIFTSPAAGGEATQLTEQPGDDADPAWHPQSSSLAFASNRDGDWEIFSMAPDGANQQQLTDDPADDQDPAWSPDGAYVAFESKRDSADRPDDDWAEVYVMLADGRDQRRLTMRDGFDAHPGLGHDPAGMTAVPSLSVCCMTADPPAQVATSLRALRPVADEIVVAVDSRVDVADLRAYDDVADRVVRFRFRPPVDRPRAWLAEQCRGDWVLSIDGDEVPGRALVDALPELVAATDVVQYWLPRRWLRPDAVTWLDEAPWWPDFQVRLVRSGATLAARAEPHAGFVAVLPSRHVDLPLYHLDCVVNDAAARAAKGERYDAAQAGRPAYGGGGLNEVLYAPERWATTAGRPVPDDDRPLIDAVLATRRAAEQTRPVAGSSAGDAGDARDRPIVPDAEIDVRASSPEMTDDDYAVGLRLFDTDVRLAPSEVRPLYVEVTNRGGAVWRWGLDQQPEVRVSYHWRATDGTVTDYEGMRSPLPCTVGPGEATLVPVWVRAPDEVGDHLLEIDLVHEHVRWFGSPLMVTVTVAERPQMEAGPC